MNSNELDALHIWALEQLCDARREDAENKTKTFSSAAHIEAYHAMVEKIEDIKSERSEP